MAKLTLSDIASITGNPVTAATTINNNWDLIVAAIENTLSRNGASPNTMAANLDMNSYRIVNLLKPLNNTEPLRKQDIADYIDLLEETTFYSGILFGKKTMQEEPISVPQVAVAEDPTTGLFGGEDVNTNPLMSIVIRGTEAFRFFGDRNTPPGDENNYRWGSPWGIGGGDPAFAFVGSNALPGLATGKIIISELGDSAELRIKFADAADTRVDSNGNTVPDAHGSATPYTDENAGRDMGFIYWHPLLRRTYSATPNYGAESRTVRPILLTYNSGTGKFEGFQKRYNSGSSGYANGETLYFRLPVGVASGTAPVIVLNGWPDYDLTRHSGATPAVNYWNAGAEISVVANTADTTLRAKDTDGSDSGGNGVTTNYRVYPHFGRSAQINTRFMSESAPFSSEGMLEFSTTRPETTGLVPRLLIGSTGFVVFPGHSIHEDGTNGFGIYNDEAYPGRIVFGVNGTPYRNRRGDFGGHYNATKAYGWANVSIPASNLGIGRAPAIAIRRGDAWDQGVDFGLVNASNFFIMQGIEPGSTTLTIDSITDNGIGQPRVHVTAGHNLRDNDTVRITGSTAGVGAYAATGDPDGTGYLDGCWTVRPIDAQTFDILGTYYKNLPPNVGSVVPVSHITYASMNWQTGDWRLGNAIRITGRSDEDNYINFAGSAATTGTVTISSAGDDTNIDIIVAPKGSGNVRFGTHSALAAETVTGYITIKDAAGNSRKIAVVS